jgi:ketosteroid isomerase-like protein
LSPGLFPAEARVVADVETIAARGARLVLHRVAVHATDDAAGPTLEALHVSRWNEHGRSDFAASYAVEDLVDALGELDRLHRAESSDEHEPWNQADRLARRFVELFTSGAREEWLPMLSPDHVTKDRRPIVGVDTSGADEVADAYPRDRATRELSSAVETVAVRFESFALIRWRATSSSGREWDSFHLTRWTADGLNDLNVIFPPDQLPAALEALDELWLAELERGDVETYRTALAWAEAYGSGDDVRLRALMHDDFVLTDHRAMGFGQLDRDTMLELMRSRIGTRGLAVPVTSAVHLLGRGAVVGSYHDRSSGRDGAEYVTNTVFLCCVRDRRISAATFFDADCVDAAVQAAATTCQT